MTLQSGGGGLQASQTVAGVLSGNILTPAFATNGTTSILGSLQTQLGANVTIVSSGTFTDVLTLALTAGTWDLLGMVLIYINGTATGMAARLYDGTSTLVSAQQLSGSVANWPVQLVCPSIYVAAGAVTIHLQGWSAAANSVAAAAMVSGGVGNNASMLKAVRIA